MTGTRPSTLRVPLGPGGEFDLIRRLLGPEEPFGEDVVLGPGDDCAVLEGGWVVSTDLFVEDVHFKREWVTLDEAGYRAAMGGLSDVAAMAADPVGMLLSLALPAGAGEEDAALVQKGVREACLGVGTEILGGDLARSPGPLVLNTVAMGRSSNPVLRRGTGPGDEIWVTGTLGGSGGAVALWTRGEEPPSPLREAFARPAARISEARWLRKRTSLHGLMDLSDGLAGDAGHLAAASDVAVVLREDWIPVHPVLLDVFGSTDGPLRLALEGGEDYELLFSVPPETLDDWVGPFQDSFNLPLTRIGWAGEGRGVFLADKEGNSRPLSWRGFSHFSNVENR